MLLRAGHLVMVGVALSGCGGDAEPASQMDGDCMAALVWQGVRYEGAQVTDPPPLGAPLADGVIPACPPDPEREVDVAALRGVHPSVAVATPGPAREYPGSDIVWLGPGYVASSGLHPLHDELRGAGWRPPVYGQDEWDCQRRRALRVRVRERPAALAGSVRVTADEETEAFIRGDDVDTYVVLDANTVVVGLRRHGVPFIAAGAELDVAARECLGEDQEPGLRGLRLIVATRVRAATP